MKAPAAATTYEQPVLQLARVRSLLRARDLTQQPLPTIAPSRRVQAGKLERVARGPYAQLRGQCGPGPASRHHDMTANRTASIRARLGQLSDTSQQDFDRTLTKYGLECLLC